MRTSLAHRAPASTSASGCLCARSNTPVCAPQARDLDGADFVGLDEKCTRLLCLESATDCDGGVVSVSQSLLRAHPHLQARTRLRSLLASPSAARA